ncbi:hypothetical protein VTH82DRAFT_42 [Thermothelomyces myriococcoides]
MERGRRLESLSQDKEESKHLQGRRILSAGTALKLLRKRV